MPSMPEAGATMPIQSPGFKAVPLSTLFCSLAKIVVVDNNNIVNIKKTFAIYFNKKTSQSY